MRRDMDLIRALLLVIEREADPKQIQASDISIADREEAEIVAHVGMLERADFIEASHMASMDDLGGGDYLIDRLTWAGHEFLDLARSDSIWSRAKERAAKVGGSISIEAMGQLLASIAKELLGQGGTA